MPVNKLQLESYIHTIRPQITKVEYGSEPSLVEMVRYYYRLHGIDPDKAEQLVREYVTAWFKEIP